MGLKKSIKRASKNVKSIGKKVYKQAKRVGKDYLKYGYGVDVDMFKSQDGGGGGMDYRGEAAKKSIVGTNRQGGSGQVKFKTEQWS